MGLRGVCCNGKCQKHWDHTEITLSGMKACDLACLGETLTIPASKVTASRASADALITYSTQHKTVTVDSPCYP